MNVLQIRLPWELYLSLCAMATKTYVHDPVSNHRHWVDKTPRMPPMSWEQVKCAEGLFEALPMAMFQASVVITDLYHDKPVTVTQVLSLLTSYVNVAIVLGLMGPPDINWLWRIVFMLFVVVVILLLLQEMMMMLTFSVAQPFRVEKLVELERRSSRSSKWKL